MKKNLISASLFFFFGFCAFVKSSPTSGTDEGSTSGQSCYSDRSDPYPFFATKTSYFAVDNEDTEEIKFEGCHGRSLWLLARHGTRTPGKKDLSKIIKNSANLRARIIANHEKQSGHLCESDLAGLVSWNFTFSLEDESILTDSGRSEHFQIGQRLKKRLPDLMGGKFQTETFQFRHTHKARTEESAQAFAKGAFPGEEDKVFSPSANNFTEKDKLLRFYDFCPKWIKQVDENEATYEEQRLFLKTDHIQNLVRRVGEKLGFEDDGSFKFKDVVLIYDICRFEKAWHPDRVSVWCSAFADEDLQVLEYHEELKYWYNSGYFYPINSMIACPLIQDLVDKFGGKSETFEDKDVSMPNATFYFSHSEAVLPFLRLLGLYRDEVRLRHDNFDEMKDRKYRTSKIGPFSSNIGFLLFDCQGSKKVLTLHQEYPIKLEQCPGPGLLCDWKDFVDIYKDKLECKFDEICSEDDIKTSSASDFKDEEEISNSSSRFSNSTINNLLIFMLLAFCYSIQCNSK